MKKINLPQWLRGAGAGILLGSAALIFTGCVATVRGPGYNAGAYYDYDYYPGADVYYYPHGHVYYWNEGGAWRSGRELPPRIVVHDEHTEHFRGHTEQPWTEHRQGEGRQGGQGHDRDHDHN